MEATSPLGTARCALILLPLALGIGPAPGTVTWWALQVDHTFKQT